jgi:hypothetical protein
MRSASLRASLRRKESTRSFFTQHLRASVGARTRPRWLDVLGYSLSPPSACLRTGSSGLVLGAADCHGSDFHSSWGAGHEYLEYSYRFFTFMSHHQAEQFYFLRRRTGVSPKAVKHPLKIMLRDLLDFLRVPPRLRGETDFRVISGFLRRFFQFQTSLTRLSSSKDFL